MTVSFPGEQITPLGDYRMQQGVVPQIDFVGAEGTIYHLQGGQAPSLGCQDGFGLVGSEGLSPPVVLLDEQGARQDGITNLDTVFDPTIITLTLEASGKTPQSFRRAVRTWLSSWQPPNVGTLNVFTQEMGEWWMPVRYVSGADKLKMMQDPSLHRRLEFEWKCRGDNAFWQGIDSVSTFSTVTGSGSDFCPLTNFGTRPNFPRFLCIAGSGTPTFTLGNGAVPTAQGTISNAGSPITFGPLQKGQRAIIYTHPRLRSVVDVSSSQPAQTLTAFQSLIEYMINSSVGNYPVPPELQAIESLFGILPPNGPMYSLLKGRFTSLSQIPGKKDGYPAQTTWIPVSIEGGAPDSQIVAAVTPYRTWPW